MRSLTYALSARSLGRTPNASAKLQKNPDISNFFAQKTLKNTFLRSFLVIFHTFSTSFGHFFFSVIIFQYIKEHSQIEQLRLPTCESVIYRISIEAFITRPPNGLATGPPT